MSDRPLLKVCDLNKCEAMCCYDGAYLRPGEAEKITRLVASNPDFFVGLPAEFIVEGKWCTTLGPKTAVAPHTYHSPSFPAHFTRTRCVFCSPNHKCQLQVLAMQQGKHPWAYKPKACYSFPLHNYGDGPEPPPTMDAEDPHDQGAEYPGFVKFTQCGMEHADGKPWRTVLAEELSYLEKDQAQLEG